MTGLHEVVVRKARRELVEAGILSKTEPPGKGFTQWGETKSGDFVERNPAIASNEIAGLRPPPPHYKKELSLKNTGGPVEDFQKDNAAGVPAGNKTEVTYTPDSPRVIDPERVQDLQHIGKQLDLNPTEIVSLLEQHGLHAVETALAEASRAGDKIYAPAAFVKRRAAHLAKTQANEAEFNSRRSAAIDREHRERIAERAAHKCAADNDMTAVDEEIAKIPPESLAAVKELALNSMGDIPRSVARRRGFEASPSWRIIAAKMWRNFLTRGEMLA